MVETRLQQGEITYHNRSFSLNPDKLIDEINQELADVAAWAFVLHARLQQVRQALEVAKL
jgi:hypothetical protein